MFMTRPPISQSELGVWIAEHMPQLAAELGPMRLDDARARLNEVTGLRIQPCDGIASSTQLFLAALKAKHNQ